MKENKRRKITTGILERSEYSFKFPCPHCKKKITIKGFIYEWKPKKAKKI